MASKKQKQSVNALSRGAGKDEAVTATALPTIQGDSTDDDDDDLEMERNFALFSKRSAMQTAGTEEESSGAEEDSSDAESTEGEDKGQPDMDKNEEEEDDGIEEDNDTDPAEMEGDSESDNDEGEPVTSDNDSDDANSNSHQSEGDSSYAQLETEDDVKRELSTMSFEEIMKLQNKVGTKAYNKIAYGPTKNKQAPKPMKRLNKHKPQEISSKKPVPFLRKVVPVKKAVSRDPRFDDLSGEYKPEIFNQTYRFIDEIRQREKQMVKKSLKKTKSDAKREELRMLLRRMENQERERKRRDQQQEKELAFKRKQRELVGKGHRPFYLKKSDKKKLELAEKYSELKKSGKLENFLSKKRKRNAMKDRRKLPNPHKA
ncbi:ribosomal RNA processing protein 36 homolog [Chanos chanos]|uniref:rRNA biogenesis protein RRP36 n=1 Tax=Chanos chanos TaxID=29144 RepID=A0A6J2V886_CHACN|nr:ribosomal RNA processing protein 36 homolog [Chanos chanos]